MANDTITSYSQPKAPQSAQDVLMLAFLFQATLCGFLFLPLAAFSYVLSKRWFPLANTAVRLLSTAIIFSWQLAAWFALLFWIRYFTILGAVTIAAFYVFFIFLNRRLFRPLFEWLKYDLAYIHQTYLAMRRNPVGAIAIAAFAILLIVVTARSIFLPVLGWDALTYHAFKAGLWVQAGGWTILDAPGGWEYYRTFFGGGELFSGWTLLFFPSGLLVSVPDVCFWLLLGLCLACLARHFGLSLLQAALVSMAGISTVEFTRLLGSGYTDICANLFLLCGLLFVLN